MKVVANKRDAQGTSGAAACALPASARRALGGTAPQGDRVEHNPLFHALRKEKFHASILDMELDGASERVCCATSRCIRTARGAARRFQRVSENQKIHMRCRCTLSARRIAGGQAGWRPDQSHHVRGRRACLPKDLPEFIEVDLSELQAHQTVRVLDLKLPAGVSPC